MAEASFASLVSDEKFLFALLLIVSGFSSGYQAMPILCLLQNVIICRLCRSFALHGIWSRILRVGLLYFVVALGISIGFLGTFNQPDWSAGNAGSSMGFAYSVCLIFVPFIGMFVFFNAALLKLKNDFVAELLTPIVFSLCWTAAHVVMMHLSPVGSFGSQAYTFSSIGSLYQVVSLTGLAGVTFSVTWTASIIESLTPATGSLSRVHQRPTTRQLIVFLLFASFVMLYGDVRRLNPANTFYQRSIDFAAPETVQVSCLPAISSSVDDMIERTKQQAQKGSKLIVWSEAIFTLYNEADVTSLHQRIQNVSREYGVYVVGTYYAGQKRLRNMAVMSDDTGKIIINYQKVHPVPGVEANTDPGQNPLPTTNTRLFGKVGLAICFDFDFPQYIQHAGAKNVDLMIQPSQTWGPLRSLHSDMDSTRAIENGFTHFRCSGGGVSGIFTTYQRTLAAYENPSSGLMVAQLPLTKNVQTIYGLCGEWFGWLCVSVVGLLVIYLCVVVGWRQANQPADGRERLQGSFRLKDDPVVS